MEERAYRILVVDDEPDIREILDYNLQQAGYKVNRAKNGLEAIEKAKRLKPDLIILDIMMPEMDGIEACKAIRLDKSLDNTLIAFLTARDDEQTEIASLDLGGDDFIQKPIKPRVLISRVKALLRRTKEEDSITDTSTIQFGGIKLNAEQHVVTVDDQIIELPKKEFKILQLLMSKPGKVFTREEIFHKVWGSDIIVGNRTIDVHIRKLRERIGEKRIKTIKGIGYKLKDKSKNR